MFVLRLLLSLLENMENWSIEHSFPVPKQTDAGHSFLTMNISNDFLRSKKNNVLPAGSQNIPRSS